MLVLFSSQLSHALDLEKQLEPQNKNSRTLEVVDPSQLKNKLSFELSGNYQSTNASHLRTTNNTTFFDLQLSVDIYEKEKTPYGVNS